MQAREKAVQWLYGQIVPNSKIRRPAPLKVNLLASYEVPRNDPDYRNIFSRSGIYDNALAVIAFTMTENFDKAEAVLSAMNKQVNDDGSLWFSVNTHNLWPSETFNTGAIKRTGAAAWAGYSAVYYILKRKSADSNFIKKSSASSEILSMAEKIADYLLNYQILSKTDKRYGLVTGGSGNIKTQAAVETYNNHAVTWASIEHNIDSYYFMRDLGRLTGNNKYSDSADLVKSGLMTLWSEKDSQFYQGISGEQVIDKTLPFDGASWGAIFLASIGELDKAAAALAAVENNFRSESEGFKGYSPYTGHYMNVNWDKLQLVWPEGSLGAAAAYIRTGNKAKALEIINNIIKMEENGGILYASVAVPNLFTTYPGVAGTAWLIIASQMLIDDNEIFWGN